MAIATLERCYNNPKVFSGVVKIRKGEAVRMMMGSSSFEKVKAIMKHFVVQVSALNLALAVCCCFNCCCCSSLSSSPSFFFVLLLYILLCLFFFFFFFFFSPSSSTSSFPHHLLFILSNKGYKVGRSAMSLFLLHDIFSSFLWWKL